MKYLNHLCLIFLFIFCSLSFFFWLFHMCFSCLWLFRKYSTLIVWGWSEIGPCIYSRLSVEHNITVSHSQFLATSFFSGLHCFSLEHSIFLPMKIWFWSVPYGVSVLQWCVCEVCYTLTVCGLKLFVPHLHFLYLVG